MITAPGEKGVQPGSMADLEKGSNRDLWRVLGNHNFNDRIEAVLGCVRCPLHLPGIQAVGRHADSTRNFSYAVTALNDLPDCLWLECFCVALAALNKLPDCRFLSLKGN